MIDINVEILARIRGEVSLKMKQCLLSMLKKFVSKIAT